MTSIEAQQKYSAKTHPHQNSYAAMYSSWLGGIVKDPAWMLVPIDDHLVHRGDGVFEAIKCVQSKIYLLEEHLDRLVHSATQISLVLPMSRDEITDVIHQTLRASGLQDAIIRLYLSRGPGLFSPNPYDSVGSQLYVVITPFKNLPEEKYQKGVRIGRSAIPIKDSWLARIKTCNYLPNVLMKKESVDRNLDFTVALDENNNLGESSTENILIVSHAGHLVHPPLQQILRGTIMTRAFELAQSLLGTDLEKIEVRPIAEKELFEVREVMMAGTTLDILPVTEYEGQPINHSRVGPVAKKLLQLIREDIRSGPRSSVLR